MHTTVAVDITTKEDSWGLRIWNIVQGLRTLQETGRTRELEVWGAIGGELVNGVIDELSYECPDPKLEEQIQNGSATAEAPPEYQTSITDYLLSAATKEYGQSITDVLKSGRSRSEQAKRIYITDVKTRASPTLPIGSSLRPTVLQLHLYHHMIENLAQGNFPLDQLASRYGLDCGLSFSDSFIAQVGNLNQDLFNDVPSLSPEFPSSQDSVDILTNNNNLSALWSFMLSQFRTTFLFPTTPLNTTPTPTPQSTSDLPCPAAQPTRLSPVLKSYLEENLQWWRGERDAKGVELSEAWKCRSCDFRDDCVWIHERDQAAVRESHERRQERQTMREVAGVEQKARTDDSKIGRSKSTI